MRTRPQGLAIIRRYEGFAARPYLCPAGRWTIGYGHVLAPAALRSVSAIDEIEAKHWLMHDVTLAEQAVGRYVTVALKQTQFDALVSFTFNLGSGVLQRSTLRQIINRGEESDVPKQWMRWVWGGGRPLPGLARRRAAELALYRME